MSGNEDITNFTHDLVYSLRERADESARRAATKGSGFDAGRELALRQALARIQSQVDAVGIRRADVLLDGIDPLVDPLGLPDDGRW